MRLLKQDVSARRQGFGSVLSADARNWSGGVGSPAGEPTRTAQCELCREKGFPSSMSIKGRLGEAARQSCVTENGRDSDSKIRAFYSAKSICVSGSVLSCLIDTACLSQRVYARTVRTLRGLTKHIELQTMKREDLNSRMGN